MIKSIGSSYLHYLGCLQACEVESLKWFVIQSSGIDQCLEMRRVPELALRIETLGAW